MLRSFSPVSTSYRPDIDGLRALAILLVILFHAFPEWLATGFIGVDIFFVISGFLITNLIVNDLHQDDFSFKKFYVRRIKRLFPALIFVLIACLMLGWFILLPYEYQQLAKDTQSAAMFFANFRFYREVGYFDLDALQKPLLHLWSLSVEEQFYLLWPLLLCLVYKTRFSFLQLTVVVGVISLGLYSYFKIIKPEYAFYLPQTRFWELLLGSLLIFIPRYKTLENFLTMLGIIFITYAIFMEKFSLFLAVIGAFLIISAGPDAWINKKILSHPFLMVIGLISYPLYLWHWPLLSFAGIVNSGVPSWQIRCIAIIMSMVFAGITYYFIEKPIRHRKKTSISSLIAMMVLIAIYSTVFKKEKMPTLLSESPEINKIDSAVQDWDFPGDHLKKFPFKKMPFYQVGKGDETVVFFGDSNIQQYAPRISNNPSLSKKVVFATKPGCLPITDVHSMRHPFKCKHFVTDVLEYIDQPNVTTVVIGAQWLAYFGHSTYFYHDEPLSSGLGIEKTYDAFEKMVKDLRAKHKKVFIILNIPVGSSFDPINMIQRSLKHVDQPKIFSERVFFGEDDGISARFASIANKYSAVMLDPKINLCIQHQCSRMTPDGNPIYKDTAHLRPFYVKKYMTFIDRVLDS